MKIVLIAPNAGTDMGGEAIRVYMYFDFLLKAGYDAFLITHGRSRPTLTGAFPPERIRYVEDSPIQKLMWQFRLPEQGINLYFHFRAARLCLEFDAADSVLHYLCPISPYEPRLPPKGYRYVLGPLSGNIYHPPAFRKRAGLRARLHKLAYRPVQTIAGWLFREKRGSAPVLVSGYDSTREALRWAGCSDAQMIAAPDSGISDIMADLPPAVHEGRNGDFVFVGRLIELKGVDLAIKALARAATDIRLTIIGDGPERPALAQLAERLGVSERVNFTAWMSSEQFGARLARARGFVFPSLCEANGIAMPEAMLIGLPVIALRWGGPAMQADDRQAIFIEPSGEEAVVIGIAEAMQKLAGDPELAAQMGAAARAHVLGPRSWESVAQNWTQSYHRLET
jgi:glycosyltransferase involved in cell wall biosynthesis